MLGGMQFLMHALPCHYLKFLALGELQATFSLKWPSAQPKTQSVPTAASHDVSSVTTRWNDRPNCGAANRMGAPGPQDGRGAPDLVGARAGVPDGSASFSATVRTPNPTVVFLYFLGHPEFCFRVQSNCGFRPSDRFMFSDLQTPLHAL